MRAFSARHKEDNMKLDKKKFLSEVDGILHADYGTDLASANKNALPRGDGRRLCRLEGGKVGG